MIAEPGVCYHPGDLPADVSPRALISVVFSFRNEAENLGPLVARLATMFATEPVEYELIFVNDASSDASLPLLVGLRRDNPRIKVLNMSRKFGVAECVRAGLAAAKGDAVIYMDTDLQDPPEVIPEMLAAWRGGADVVHTVRTRRHGESAMKMRLTALAYRLIRAGSSIELPVDAGDFKLLSRAAVRHLLVLGESDPYLRGLVVWIGFKQVLVQYERKARHGGATHFPFLHRNPWKTAITGLTSFSFLPIYAVGVVAIAGVIVALLTIAAGVYMQMSGMSRSALVGIIGVMMFFWATTLVAIATVGIYVIRTYKDVRARPQYIVASSIGFDGDEP